jgi:hypothetical protein
MEKTQPCETQRKEYEQCLKPYESDLDAYKLFFCERQQKSFVSCKEFDKWLLKTVTEKTKQMGK